MDINYFDKYITYMEQRNLNKYYVLDVLNACVNFEFYTSHLKRFINMESMHGYDNGYIFSNDMDINDDEYFGKDKVMFYYGDDDKAYDIVDYNELYKYLSATCEFYIEKNPEEKDTVEKLLEKIKNNYNVK